VHPRAASDLENSLFLAEFGMNSKSYKTLIGHDLQKVVIVMSESVPNFDNRLLSLNIELCGFHLNI
jgi:hypothetical protein